jgi:hypothetical protein
VDKKSEYPVKASEIMMGNGEVVYLASSEEGAATMEVKTTGLVDSMDC